MPNLTISLPAAHITALGVAPIAVDDDPPVAVTEDRRRALIQQEI